MERLSARYRALPQDLRVAGITTLGAANLWLARPTAGAQCALWCEGRRKKEPPSCPSWACWDILCVQAGASWHDNCVRYEGLTLQIPEQRTNAFRAGKVRVHQYPMALSPCSGPRCLARFGPMDRTPSPNKAQDHQISRLNPLDGRPVEMWTRQAP